MSVINRMLKDLDQRQQTARTQTYTPAAVAPQPIHWIWIIVTVLFSAAVIIGGLNLWWMYADKKQHDQEPVQVTEVTPATAGDTAKETGKVVQQDPILEQPQTEVIEQPESPVQSPVKNQAIVDVSALQPVAEAKPNLATEKLSNNKNATASADPIERTAIDEPKTESKPAPSAKVVKKQPQNTGTLEVTRVQLSPDELAANNLEKARAAFDKGNRTEGQTLLEKALVVKPDHVEVRSELAAYWYGRGMTTRALTLLQQGLDMRPQQAEWQLLFARILERIGRVEQAYTALLNISSDAPEAPELMKLRAAAATQLGYFNEAAADYTVLASQFGEGRWWLAAAVAHEDGDNLEAAVRCYQQALQSRDLGSDARQYVEQRLAILEGY